jgi:hypothetical protein
MKYMIVAAEHFHSEPPRIGLHRYGITLAFITQSSLIFVVDTTVMVAILKLEDPDADPHHLRKLLNSPVILPLLNNHTACGVEMTFGELLQKAYMAPDEGGDEEEADEDDLIPDVWIRKWDPGHNAVTKTGQWWEHQNETLKIGDVFKAAEAGSADMSQKKWCVEIVAKKGDYVVALVNDNGQESGKALGAYSVLSLKTVLTDTRRSSK